MTTPIINIDIESLTTKPTVAKRVYKPRMSTIVNKAVLLKQMSTQNVNIYPNLPAITIFIPDVKEEVEPMIVEPIVQDPIDDP